jgi:hypothetical protein
MDARTIEDVLKVLEGQIVTIVNPQSYVRTLTGFTIDEETYSAKIISFESGTLKVLIEYIFDPKTKAKEKMYEFIRVDHIKRVAIAKTDKLIIL